MKARVVHDLDGGEPLGANIARIVAVRVAELRSFVPAAFDPADVTALHDLRIAAKRLRYILELAGEACVGPQAKPAVALLKELQEVLGEVHDSDEMLPRLMEHGGDGVELLVARVRVRRAERFAGFVVLWPRVVAAATSCLQRDHREGVPFLNQP